MSTKMPFFYKRYLRCTPENGLVPNDYNRRERISCVVLMADCWDMKYYNSAWMDNDQLSKVNNSDDDYTLVPDVDLVADNGRFVFCSDDALQDEKDAIAKMKELWTQV